MTSQGPGVRIVRTTPRHKISAAPESMGGTQHATIPMLIHEKHTEIRTRLACLVVILSCLGNGMTSGK